MRLLYIYTKWVYTQYTHYGYGQPEWDCAAFKQDYQDEMQKKSSVLIEPLHYCAPLVDVQMKDYHCSI